MAATGTAAISNTRNPPCRRFYQCIRTSLKHPRLIGEGGARNRYMRIQWWVVFWRLTVLAQIPIVALVAPERLENVPFSFFLLVLALAYTALFVNPLARMDLSLPAVIVIGGLTLDCLAWVVFRDPLYRLCSRRPWVLAIEHLYLSVLLVVTLVSGIPLFYALYLGVVVMMNGLFAGPIGNVALTAVLNAGILISHALASERSLGQLVSEIIRSLESQKKDASLDSAA